MSEWISVKTVNKHNLNILQDVALSSVTGIVTGKTTLNTLLSLKIQQAAIIGKLKKKLFKHFGKTLLLT